MLRSFESQRLWAHTNGLDLGKLIFERLSNDFTIGNYKSHIWISFGRQSNANKIRRQSDAKFNGI